MKRRILTLIMAFCLTLLCGCNKSDLHTSQTGSDIGDNSQGNTDSDALVFADFVGEYPENPIPILTLNEDEIRSVIDAQSNLKCADDLYINAPENASVYEYSTYGVHVPQFEYTGDQFRKDFEATFKYLFPDREINMDYLKYEMFLDYDYEKVTYTTEEGYVKDKETLPGMVEFYYDEMPERTENWNSPVYVELRLEIGSGNGVINKGEATYLAGKVDYGEDGSETTGTYIKLSSFEPLGYFEDVGKYPPYSEKSFNLLDGEMKICDAVKFVEDYLNNIPISTGLTRNMRTRVYCVYVLRIDDSTYGYYFRTEPQFQGVNYEPVVYGSFSGNKRYDGSGGAAFMIRSDDVDYIHAICGHEWTFDVSACKEIVPFETAIQTISQKLSKRVEFEVISVEFVYVKEFDKDEEGHIKIDTYEARYRPAWRITTGNRNDDRTYICYVEAVNSEEFNYFSTPGITYYDE